MKSMSIWRKLKRAALIATIAGGAITVAAYFFPSASNDIDVENGVSGGVQINGPGNGVTQYNGPVTIFSQELANNKLSEQYRSDAKTSRRLAEHYRNLALSVPLSGAKKELQFAEIEYLEGERLYVQEDYVGALAKYQSSIIKYQSLWFESRSKMSIKEVEKKTGSERMSISSSVSSHECLSLSAGDSDTERAYYSRSNYCRELGQGIERLIGCELSKLSASVFERSGVVQQYGLNEEYTDQTVNITYDKSDACSSQVPEAFVASRRIFHGLPKMLSESKSPLQVFALLVTFGVHRADH